MATTRQDQRTLVHIVRVIAVVQRDNPFVHTHELMHGTWVEALGAGKGRNNVPPGDIFPTNPRELRENPPQQVADGSIVRAPGCSFRQENVLLLFRGINPFTEQVGVGAWR